VETPCKLQRVLELLKDAFAKVLGVPRMTRGPRIPQIHQFPLRRHLCFRNGANSVQLCSEYKRGILCYFVDNRVHIHGTVHHPPRVLHGVTSVSRNSPVLVLSSTKPMVLAKDRSCQARIQIVGRVLGKRRKSCQLDDNTKALLPCTKIGKYIRSKRRAHFRLLIHISI
jgi:hypothetical protein